MKRAYATILTTENFIDGIRVMYNSLRRFSTVDFVVFVTKDISDEKKNILRDCGMTVIASDVPEFPDDVISDEQKRDRWNETLFKLVIFKEYGFDKLVYLDSDLLIRGNIDELFNQENWSSVADKTFYPECGREGLNAGVMVIEPSNSLYEDLISVVPVVAKEKKIFGDQDVINKYLEQKGITNRAVLDRTFNTCFYSLKAGEEPRVVHFIFASKPWMWSKSACLLKCIKWILKGCFCRVRILKEYLSYLQR